MPISRRPQPEQEQPTRVPSDDWAAIRGFPPAYWTKAGAALYLGDVRECLRALPARSVHCVVTSPPYWGLRDYGTGTWEGGSTECDHSCGTNRNDKGSATLNAGGVKEHGAGKNYYKDICHTCGAKRTDKQIGQEPSPDCSTHGQAQCVACFVCSMVSVFREVYRVLRDDGVCWLNLGDTYGGGPTGGEGKQHTNLGSYGYIRRNGGLPNGNLIGIPWRVALALQANGWILRSDMPWVKRCSMPESVTNRPCKSLEYVFLLAKDEGYYFDMDAVRPSTTTKTRAGGACFGRVLDSEAATNAKSHNRRYNRPEYIDRSFRNSDLWFQSVNKPHGIVGVGDEMVGIDATPKGYKGAHFAKFPPKLITPLILASTSEHGCCAQCGAPWERVSARGTDDDCKERSPHTIRWQQMCACQTDDIVPAIVLDPFVGSGTTVATALQLGRCGVGVDLSEEYLRDNAVPRIEAALTGNHPLKKTVPVPRDSPPPPRRLRG